MDIYSSSVLYRFFLKEHPIETKDEIKKKFFEKDWTEEQVYAFINNYRMHSPYEVAYVLFLRLLFLYYMKHLVYLFQHSLINILISHHQEFYVHLFHKDYIQHL